MVAALVLVALVALPRVTRVAGRQRALERLLVVDQTGARVREALRDQFLGGHVLLGGVAHPAAPVGEGDPAGLQIPVQVLLLAHAPHVAALQDVQRLRHAGAARGGGRHPVHVQSPVVGTRRPLRARRVRLEVLRRHVARPHGAARPVGDRGPAHGPHDVAAQLALVERVGALAGQLVVGAGQIGVLEGGAGPGELAARQEQTGGRREVPEPCLVVGRLLPEGLIDREPAPRQPRSRRQRLPQRLVAELAQGRLPGRGGARGPDAEAAGDRLLEGDRLPVLGEQVLVRAERGLLAAVDGVHLAGGRVVVHEVPAAADARRVRLRHAERSRRRHGGVGGGPAALEHLDTGCGGVGVHARYGSAVPRRHGNLHRATPLVPAPDGGHGPRAHHQRAEPEPRHPHLSRSRRSPPASRSRRSRPGRGARPHSTRPTLPDPARADAGPAATAVGRPGVAAEGCGGVAVTPGTGTWLGTARTLVVIRGRHPGPPWR